MNLFTIAILFSGMVGGDSALFVPVSRESGPLVAGSHPGSAGRLDPRQPAIHPPRVEGNLSPSTRAAIAFAVDSEPARLPVRNVGATVPTNPIIGPTGGVPGDIVLLDASQAKAKAYAWDCIPLNLDAQGKPLTTIVALGDKAIVSSRPGTRTAILSIVRDDGTIQLFQWTVTISGTPTPQPPEPKPDDPPKPPKPAGGLRVVVVRETGDASKVDAVFAKSVRDYLKSKCAKDAAGNPEFRVWDDDQQFSDKESYTLREMFQKAQPFQSLPALIVMNDANPTAKAMPLPATPDDLLAELRKWGGQ